MVDLTIIYLTQNNLPEAWNAFQMKHLLRAIGDCPVVSVSREPLDFGVNLIQTEAASGWNVYRQINRAAKLANTKYIAMAEDDTLYTREHYTDFRPPDDAVAYDLSRWSLFSWEKRPVYSAIYKHGNFAMIGPTDLVVEATDERLAKHPSGHEYAGEIGRRVVERHLRVTRRKLVEYRSEGPIVNLCHPYGLSPTYTDVRGKQRKHGELRAFDIPRWGPAKDIVDIYNSEVVHA